MNYIKIVTKASTGVYKEYYMGTDVKSLTVTNGGSGSTRSTSVAIVTVSGVTHALGLTAGILAADDQKVIDYFWGRIISASEQGNDFAGIAAQMGTSDPGVVGGGAANAGGAGILNLTISGGSAPILITIDSDTVS
jgi:hypothetical protein